MQTQIEPQDNSFAFSKLGIVLYFGTEHSPDSTAIITLQKTYSTVIGFNYIAYCNTSL